MGGYQLLNELQVIPATPEHAEFVGRIYNQNIEALHDRDIYDWAEIFS